jgi:hypothetical protein
VGGLVTAWLDFRAASYHVYMQRVAANGAVLWNPAGVAASTGGDADGLRVIGDGYGSAIASWYVYGASSYDIYAQRVTAAGVVSWVAGGLPVCAAANDQYYADLTSDGAGGAILAWQDYRNFVGTFTDIYAQRIYSTGAAAWTPDGVPVCLEANHQFIPTLAADKSGGAIIAWGDYRNGMGQDQYAQRINASGATLWTPDGVAISLASHDQSSQQVLADGAGGAVIAWQDMRNGLIADVYAQRVDGSGVVKWTADGAAVCTEMLEQAEPHMVSDGVGGAAHGPRRVLGLSRPRDRFCSRCAGRSGTAGQRCLGRKPLRRVAG